MSQAARALSALLLICGFSTANAQCRLPMPPARYDHGPVSVIEYRVDDPDASCRNGGHAWAYVGCAMKIAYDVDRIRFGASWLVYLPKHSVHGCAVAEVRRHEYGHARGWPADHSH